MFVCFGTASACNLAAIGVERYLAITRPLTHHCAIISRRTLAGILLVWTYAILSSICSYFAWHNLDYMEPGFSISFKYALPLLLLDNLIPLSICVVAYTLIYRISLEHSCRIGLLCGWTFDGQKTRIIKEKKSAKTLSVLVGVFVACSLPFFIFHAVDAAFNEQLPNRRYASHVVKWLCYINSACNWALYGFLNQDFRKVLFAIFKKCHLRIVSVLRSNRVVPFS